MRRASRRHHIGLRENPRLCILFSIYLSPLSCSPHHRGPGDVIDGSPPPPFLNRDLNRLSHGYPRPLDRSVHSVERLETEAILSDSRYFGNLKISKNPLSLSLSLFLLLESFSILLYRSNYLRKKEGTENDRDGRIPSLLPARGGVEGMEGPSQSNWAVGVCRFGCSRGRRARAGTRSGREHASR